MGTMSFLAAVQGTGNESLVATLRTGDIPVDYDSIIDDADWSQLFYAWARSVETDVDTAGLSQLLQQAWSDGWPRHTDGSLDGEMDAGQVRRLVNSARSVTIGGESNTDQAKKESDVTTVADDTDQYPDDALVVETTYAADLLWRAVCADLAILVASFTRDLDTVRMDYDPSRPTLSVEELREQITANNRQVMTDTDDGGAIALEVFRLGDGDPIIVLDDYRSDTFRAETPVYQGIVSKRRAWHGGGTWELDPPAGQWRDWISFELETRCGSRKKVVDIG